MVDAATQEIIAGVLQGLSDDPQIARNIQAAAGGHYIGGAMPASLVNLGGNFGHSPLTVNQGSFSNPLLGMVASGYVNNMMDPVRNEVAGVMYQQNQHQIQQSAFVESLAKNMSQRMEANGFAGAMPFARDMARQTFGGPMEEQMLQVISRFGMDKDTSLAEGMMKTGMSTIGLNQFGLIGSLTKRDELSKLRAAIEQAGASEGLAEALGTATALGDPRLGLESLSEQAKGYRGGENLGQITADLKKSKETLGLGKRQTLGLLGDVYDGIIEDILPNLGEFVDKIARLESHGIRAHEYAAQVQKTRANLRGLGIRDETAAVDVVDRALAGGDTVNQIYRDAGIKNFNIKQFQSERLAAETRLAGSTEARTLGLVLEAMGVDPNDETEISKAIKGGFAGLEEIDPALHKDLSSFGLLGVANKIVRREGNYTAISADVFRSGPGQAYLDAGLRDSTFRTSALKQIFDFEGVVRELPASVKEALLDGEDSAGRLATYKGLLSMSQLGLPKYKDTAARDRFMSSHGLTLKDEMVVDDATQTKLSLDFLSKQGGTLSRNLKEAGMLAIMGFDSIEDMNKDNNAIMLRGLSGKPGDKDSDFKKATEHIEQLTKGGGAKTSAKTLMGVALDAAISVHGPGDFSEFLNMVTPKYKRMGQLAGRSDGMNEEWIEALEYFKKEIGNNPTLLEKLGGEKGIKGAGFSEIGSSLAELADKQKRIMEESDPHSEDYSEARALFDMIGQLNTKMKAGGVVEDEDKAHGEKVEDLLGQIVENTSPDKKNTVPDSGKSRSEILSDVGSSI